MWLTGGIASGKSALAERLAARGAFLADADVMARAVVAPGNPALVEIVELFGKRVLQPDGTLHRAALRQIVFADDEARQRLEAINHPRIRAGLREACLQADAPYAVAAIPLLTEGGGRAAYPWLQRIVVVDVPVERQIERLLTRDGNTPELAQRMIAAQATRGARLAIADDIIDNSGTLQALDEAAAALDTLYRRLATLASMQ